MTYYLGFVEKPVRGVTRRRESLPDAGIRQERIPGGAKSKKAGVDFMILLDRPILIVYHSNEQQRGFPYEH